jgi:hypothetical protein
MRLGISHARVKRSRVKAPDLVVARVGIFRFRWRYGDDRRKGEITRDS